MHFADESIYFACGSSQCVSTAGQKACASVAGQSLCLRPLLQLCCPAANAWDQMHVLGLHAKAHQVELG